MNDLAFAKEPYRVDDVGIVTVAQNVVVGRSGFLFRRKIFMQVSENVSLRL